MTLVLSGPFDTSQLPRIAPDPVTVTVARTIVPGYEAQYLVWTDEVVAALRQAKGCLGAGVLQPGPEGGEHQIVFRFMDGLSLRAWEKSPERAELMERSKEFVLAERVQRTVGVEDWFELSTRAEPKGPWWGRIVRDVLWVYPVAIGASIFIAPMLAALPTLARILASSALITAVMRLAVSPVRGKLRARRRL